MNIKKIKIYLDTSVISAFFDDRNPERQDLTRDFFEKIQKFDVYISDIVRAEINKIKSEELKQKVKVFIRDFKTLLMSDEITQLANEYIQNNAIPADYKEDGLHIAFATLNEIDYLLSWNFRHIVKLKTKQLINVVNLNFNSLPILCPIVFNVYERLKTQFWR